MGEIVALAKGSLFAGRFTIEGLAGKGGMGEVYRARDAFTGTAVALKVMQAQGDGLEGIERFKREARLLSELEHPGIVSYLSHGEAEDGRPFLAIEWLAGRDLAERLADGPLGLRDCVTLFTRAADALAAAHRRGIVHRDIKPTNLFLRDNRIDRVTLLDFGIARRALGQSALTRTGSLIGTPGYMAPEQARGDGEIGPSADVFALGCVLFECLVGQSPFYARDAVAGLARVLFEDVPSVDDLRPDTPPALCLLLERMLDKDPSRRPPDAAALLDEIARLKLDLVEEQVAWPAHAARRAPAALSGEAMQLLCVVVATQGAAMAAPPAVREAVRSRLLKLRARFEWLADGSLVVVVPPAQSAVDQATHAARCALAIKEQWPEAAVALTTGRGLLTERLPVGEAIERAASLVRMPSGEGPASSARRAAPTTDTGVWLDEVSAKLLEPRFGITTDGAFPILRGEREGTADESRPLLGRPTPCVGREQELAQLLRAIQASIEDREPSGALVIAPPGMGKSRLRHELLRRLRASSRDIEVLFGSGAPLTAGSPHGLLGEAIRRLCDVRAGDAPAVQAEKIQKRVGQHVAAEQVKRVADFITTICGVPVEEPGIVLRAAFGDAKIMSEQTLRAFLDFASAECAARPLLLVLEDFHWGDLATVRLIDAALLELRGRPLFVLAFARPEVTDLFPKLWEGRAVERVRLKGLSRKAAERLASVVLGADAPAFAVERIVEHAAGNALFLEELIRAAVEGKAEGQPATVLAMLQARLSCLDPLSRRVLCAASIFGQTFWRGGVLTLLGPERDTRQTEERLEQLVQAELVERQWHPRLPDEVEYKFRHVLVRDAAYSLLTDADRALGHRLAGQYLERIGESDPMVLAEHAYEGRDLERAALHYLHAAEQALRVDDYDGMLVRAERGIACGARGEIRGRLLAVKLEACLWRLEWPTALAAGREAMGLLLPGSVHWNNAAASIVVMTVNLGSSGEVDALASALSRVEPTPDSVASCVIAMATTTCMLLMVTAREPVLRLLARLEALAPRLVEDDLFARGLLRMASTVNRFFTGEDLWETHELAASVVDLLTTACASRWRGMAWFVLATTKWALGDDAEAERMIREYMADALRTNDAFSISSARFYLLLCLAERRASENREEITALANILIEDGAMDDTLGAAYGALSRVHLFEGRLEQAREAAEKSLENMKYIRCWRPLVQRTLIEVLLRSGQTDAALEVADECAHVLEARGGSAGFAEVPMRLAMTEARAAAGDMASARASLAETIRVIESRAAKIPDPALRARFLAIPEHARAMELGRVWLDGA